jgi:predicted nucleotidyltransferase
LEFEDWQFRRNWKWGLNEYDRLLHTELSDAILLAFCKLIHPGSLLRKVLRLVDTEVCMRLSQEQVAAIRISVCEVFGADAKVWLFGSRVDDSRRGGDIDLLVRPAATHVSSSLISKVRLLHKLEGRIGERKVDVVVEAADDARPIVRVAHETGVQL